MTANSTKTVSVSTTIHDDT